MNRNTTAAEALFQCAAAAIADASNERLQHFITTLQAVCNRSDAISLFRTLRYTRIRLYAAFDDRQRRMFTSVVGCLDTELELLARYGGQLRPTATRLRWTGTFVELVELIYGLQEMRCIDDGERPINELFAHFGSQFGLEIKIRNCYDAYLDIKRRKNDSRTYFLDKMRERMNLRMQRDDEKERARRR